MVTLTLGMPLFANSENPSKGIITMGIANLPQEIKVINEGEEKTYTPSFKDQTFALHDDDNFSMGNTTRCDPFIGSTTEQIEIGITVQARFKWGEYDINTRNVPRNNVGPVGSATLIIPKGSNVYGRCRSETQDLTAITFQSANPADQTNAFDRPFEIRWTQE